MLAGVIAMNYPRRKKSQMLLRNDEKAEFYQVVSPQNPGVQAAKRIQAAHRLVLSGTPIQNSVLELWSLFDFLMPGFLGSERTFNAQYGKALAAAKASKRGSKEAEAGLLSMEGLHKQVQHVTVARV